MRRVIIESPYAGHIERNAAYARACMLDCLERGEAPFASHLLYTQVLRDEEPEERAQGIEAGLAWHVCADRVAVYEDLGISGGMQIAIDRLLAKAPEKLERRQVPAPLLARFLPPRFELTGEGPFLLLHRANTSIVTGLPIKEYDVPIAASNAAIDLFDIAWKRHAEFREQARAAARWISERMR